jgi:hypothetical protein
MDTDSAGGRLSQYAAVRFSFAFNIIRLPLSGISALIINSFRGLYVS